MKLRTLALCALVLALALPTFGASLMKPGKWQVTIQTEMANMPIKMPAMTFTHCVTKEEAENPQPPKTKNDKSDCQVSDYKIDGSTVTWSVTCTGKQPMTGEGKMTFSGDAYEGTTHLKADQMEMSQKFTGKLLGACDEK
ncbi:MAG TPA: DUF3617 domain-containing protein [Thermoanaerobaculia bacterium]|nr:DUF3617 domain-containing protein [Thermoanaerobaculia bacterium]